MATGKVKLFNHDRGFGFIRKDDGSGDIFVHITDVNQAGIKSIYEGDKLSFDIVDNKGKVKAANIKIL